MLDRLKNQKAEAQKSVPQAEKSEQKNRDGLLREWFTKGREWATTKGDYKTLSELDRELTSLDGAEAEFAAFNPAPRDRLLSDRELRSAVKNFQANVVRKVTQAARLSRADLLRNDIELAFARGAVEFFREVKGQLET